jgi:hypothetical protein
MVWAWTLLDREGSVVPEVPVEDLGRADEFTSQSEAETWIGLNWKALLDAGIDAVELTEDGRKVYGPMGLAPATPDQA